MNLVFIEVSTCIGACAADSELNLLRLYIKRWIAILLHHSKAMSLCCESELVSLVLNQDNIPFAEALRRRIKLTDFNLNFQTAYRSLVSRMTTQQFFHAVFLEHRIVRSADSLLLLYPLKRTLCSKHAPKLRRRSGIGVMKFMMKCGISAPSKIVNYCEKCKISSADIISHFSIYHPNNGLFEDINFDQGTDVTNIVEIDKPISLEPPPLFYPEVFGIKSAFC